MKFRTTLARALVVGILAALAGPVAAQQAYPSKPIRMIVPYSSGGTTDLLGRLIGRKLTERWGQPVIVDNRPGGNSIIGTDALAKSPPDGYTLMTMAIAFAITPSLLPTPYDPIKDFAPVATIGRGELVLVLNPSLPANNLQELIALAKSKPGQLNYGSSGTGSPQHVAGELLNILAGIKTQHVPYKGATLAVNDLLGGRVQMYYSPPGDVLPFIKAGKFRAIAINGKSRNSALPQVPTFAEAGLPDFDVQNWFGVLAPAGTPKDIVDKLSTEIAKILVMPDIKEMLASMGVDPFISTPEHFAALIKADMAQYAKVIKIANIKLE
jgi:tripartite-type tricarboxylate transporter receptor subunit TctC